MSNVKYTILDKLAIFVIDIKASVGLIVPFSE
jgi:hypothetical protein